MTLRSITLAVVFLLFSEAARAQGFLKAKDRMIVDEKGEKVMLRGMGLGGWMLQEGYMLKVRNIGQQQHKIRSKIQELIGSEKTAEFYDTWLKNHTRKIDIDSMAAWGFNSVRLPMHYNLYTLPVEQEPVPGENTWLEKGFAMTDSLLQWCKANKMYLILDLHAAPGGQGNDVNISDRDTEKPSLWQSEANLQKTIALWKKLAARYANEEWIGAYDIINEPNWGFEKVDDKNGCGEQSNIPLKKLMVDITHAIREVDKKHIIIIEGNCWGNNYNGVLPPWDNNMVLSFHKYWNYTDQASIKKFLDLRDQYNMPIWLGETGENSNVWFTGAIRLAEDNDIGWAWWPLKKMGFNNPLEIKINDGYQQILDFWAGKAPQPASSEAYESLMQQAEALKLENNIYHKDVIDAMFRQVTSATAIPFKDHVIEKVSSVDAVDYDLGRVGVAYFDNDTANYYISTGGERKPWNRGNTYRNDGVDIQSITVDGSKSFFIDNIERGEWWQYTVRVARAGTYTLKLHVAAISPSGKVSVAVNKRSVQKAVSVPGAGSGKFTPVEFKNVRLTTGANVIRVTAEEEGFNFSKLEFLRH
jgi:endoglucanase